MQKFNIKKQIRNLFGITVVSSFKLASASWVALLALRGFSIVEIGLLESIFHIVSMCFEIPSGVVADVLGRKKTMICSLYMSIISAMFMLFSGSFATTALAIGLSALSYNLASGTREALAYDSLKKVSQEKEYNHFASTEMMLYRISSSTAMLCAGFALWLGYRKAYALDVLVGVFSLLFAYGLKEVPASEVQEQLSVWARVRVCVMESIGFLKRGHKIKMIIFINTLVGAIGTLMLFFLQAKLPLAGLEHFLLGPALFIMGLGSALGAKVVARFAKKKYRVVVLISVLGISFSIITLVIGNPYLMCLGGFVASFSDDFIEVRTDILLNDMIPSEQRATLISVCSFAFSVVMIILSPIMGWFMS